MRLSDTTLHALPQAVARPGYDRAQVQPGIVHLGVGAFHRAHQAVCTDAVLAGGDLRWGIIGASLRSPETRDALAPQDNLYTLNIRGTTDAYAVIGSLCGLLTAPENPTALIDAMSRPGIAIVSLTITEKAYCLDPASGSLDEAHPDILHDLANQDTPRSAVGFLAAAISRRRATGLPPFTVLCCDNLAANGATLHRALARFGTLRRPGLGAYIEDNIACPNTMVDRIVPATTAADRTRIAAAIGQHDAWPVIAEPFLQWVIEDNFPAGRPAWENCGATIVSDVAPFEAMKLRLLNGSHSALAYLGQLAGHDTVADAVRDTCLAGFVRGLMHDAAETLSVPPGTDVTGYQTALMARFANPALKHRTAQIAMDGSQKLPPRLLSVMRDRAARGLPTARHAMAVAAWVQYVLTTKELRDPRADELRDATTPERLLELMKINASDSGEVLGAFQKLREGQGAALDPLRAEP